MHARGMTWLITGTSSGFGRILTEKLLARGERVAATLRKMDALDDLRARYGDLLWTARLDLTDTAAIRSTVDRAFAELGRIDVVCSNAGYGLFGAAEALRDDQIEHVIATNLVGSMQLVRAVLPHLRRQGGGRILQVSSAGGQATYPNFSVYHATKWGIEGFVETVAKEVEALGIDVTLGEPGAPQTDFAKNLVMVPAMPEYDRTAAGEVRRALESGAWQIRGDAGKMCDAILGFVDRGAKARRLALGADTYADVARTLEERRAELESQKEIANACVS